MTTQERIAALAEKVKNPPSWWWKALGGLLLFVAAVWIAYLLSQRQKALAAAKNELATHKLEAEPAANAAKVEVDVAKRRTAEIAAEETLRKLTIDEAALVLQQEAYANQKAQLQAVYDNDWETLNKLAGVKP